MDDPKLEQARLLNRAIRAMQTRVAMRALPKPVPCDDQVKDLTVHQFSTLMLIRDQGELSIKEIAEAGHVSPPSASAMVDRLVDQNLLHRRPSPTDRREVRVSLSEAGRGAVDTFEEHMLSGLMELLDKIGPELAQQWCDLYSHILEIIGSPLSPAQTPVQREGTFGGTTS